MSLPQKNEHYTYADYCTWDDDKRWELIHGVAYAMAPAPSPIHQDISAELTFQLKAYLKGKPCKLFPAPFDVRLNADDEDDTVVQPDLTVVCDKSKIDDKGCRGVPDFVIEILSPSNAKYDRWVKSNLYRSVKVREYWIVSPDEKIVDVYILNDSDGNYIHKFYSEKDAAPVTALPGCQINLQEVFAF